MYECGVQLKRCVVVCSVVLQSGLVGDVVLDGSILCLYCCKNGDLPVCSCANVLLVFRGSVCLFLLMLGAILVNEDFWLGVCEMLMYMLTMWVCVYLRCCFIASSVF